MKGFRLQKPRLLHRHPDALETRGFNGQAAVAAVDWKESPSARLAKMDKPLRIPCLWRAQRDQKSPLRRCFKSRPSGRTRYAGFASGCRLIIGSIEKTDGPGRLSGLLSGCPPTDTRPQARAKLGKGGIRVIAPPMQVFFSSQICLTAKKSADGVHEREKKGGAMPSRHQKTIVEHKRAELVAEIAIGAFELGKIDRGTVAHLVAAFQRVADLIPADIGAVEF